MKQKIPSDSRKRTRNVSGLSVSPKGAGVSTFFQRKGCQGFTGPVPSTFLDKQIIYRTKIIDSLKSMKRNLQYCRMMRKI